MSRELEGLTRRLDAVGSRSNDLENALARIGARVEALERRMDQLAAQIAHSRASRAPSAAGGEPATAPPAPPEGPAREEGAPRGRLAGIPSDGPATARDLYQAGMAKYRAGDRAAAALIFYDVVTGYPTDPIREVAQFQMAEIFYLEKDFKGALREFEGLLAAVPNGTKTADVLLKIGLCQRALGDETGARRTWERLIREHPDSAASRQARTLLRRSRSG